MALQASVSGRFAASCGTRQRDGHSLASSLVGRPGVVAESIVLSRLSFLGCTQSLRCSFASNFAPAGKTKRLLVTALIKRKKDYKLDSVIQREKKLKRVMRIKEILVKQPGQVMSLRDLGKHRRYLGLTGKKRVIALLNKFSTVFQVYEEGCNAMYFRFTPQAKKQYREEQKLKKEMEDVAVTKLRKLLMMSIDNSIALQKVKHIRRDLGLPDDFATSDFLPRHSQYFKMGTCSLGPLLILEGWDSSLAVTSLEEAAEEKLKARQELEDDLARSSGEEVVEEEESVLARTPRFTKKNLNLPKGQQIKKKDREKLLKFQEVPAISPYGDKTGLNPSSAEAEKAAVLVVHELLSLTSEKRILVDHLTHFRRDFKFSQRIRSMLIRHPEYFYVSLKGVRDSVFLREAYEDSELKEKDPLVLLKERMTAILEQGRIDEKLDEISDDEEDGDEDEDGDDEWDEEEADDGDDEWDEEEDEESVAQIRAQVQRVKAPTASREIW